MKTATLTAIRLAAAHTAPEVIARHVDGRDVPADAANHIRDCKLCRARASDARLLRALLAGSNDTAHKSVPLDAQTIAGYHDQALACDELAGVDRRLLRDDAALLQTIELRLALNASLRAEPPDTQLIARIAAQFSMPRTLPAARISSLGTLIIDRDADIPAFHFHAATPERLANSTVPADTNVNDSGSYPAPAARREVTLHAGRHTVRIRMAPRRKLELFIFDEQHFRPANGVHIGCEPEAGAALARTTNQSGSAAFDLPDGHARLSIDAGDRWVLELR